MSARILIIDDSEHLRDVLQMTLEFSNYAVTAAGDGSQGLEAARKGSFDLIFTDLDMPVMDGLEFVRRYRAEFGPATPIIVVTAENDAMIRTAIEAGASGSVTKPFDPIGLLAVVAQYLKS